MRVVYFCNKPRNPTGGTNVIYRHVRLLNEMGVPAAVLYARAGGKEHAETPTISEQMLRENDYVIIPEISAAEIASKLIPAQMHYGIFVQNGYYLSHRAREYAELAIDCAYHHASHLLSISDHTSELIQLHYPEAANRIVRMGCSIDSTHFYAGQAKEKIITYMPRKNSLHSDALIFALKKQLPADWQILAIDKLSQSETATLLRRSAIFLAFSNLEGLGLPPIEAALCGNFVIGYHGGGGLDYWRAPNFEAVAVGDLFDFVAKVKRCVVEIESATATSLHSGMKALQHQYSAESEKQYLQQFVENIQTTMQKKSEKPVDVRLQNRASFLHGLLGKWNTRRRQSGWQNYTT